MLKYCSIVGSSHINKNKVCEDSCFAIKIKGCYALWVADGIGSAKHPDVASSKLSVFISDFLNTLPIHIDQTEITTILQQGLEMIHTQFLAYIDTYFPSNNLLAFGTTLTLVLVYPKYIAIAHVGDGGVFGKVDRYHSITNVQKNGSHNCTYSFLRGKDHWEFMVLDNKYTQIVVCSDGMYDYLYNDGNIRQNCLEEIETSNLYDYLKTVRDNGYSDDDLSIASLKVNFD